MTGKKLLPILLSVLSLCAFSAQEPQKSSNKIVIQAGGLTFTFSAPAKGMGLCSLKNREGQEFLSPQSKSGWARLWRVKLTSDRKNPKAFVTVNNMTRCARAYAKPGDPAKLVWEGVKVGDEPAAIDVTLSIGTDRTTGMADLRISVRNRSSKYGIFQTYCPDLELGYLSPEGKDDFLLLNPAEGRQMQDPIHWARNTEQETERFMLTTDGESDVNIEKGTTGFGFGACEPYGLPYPSDRGQMQFAAYYVKHGNFYHSAAEKGAGLYLATHDWDFNPKVFFASPWPSRKNLLFSISHLPTESCRPGLDYRQPYPMLIGGFKGDWFDASMIYRKNVQRAPWLKKGKLAGRPDVPEWVKRATAVYRGHSWDTTVAKNVPCIEAYRKYVAGPMGVQWYAWDADLLPGGTMDCGCFPPNSRAKEGFPEAVARLKKQDIHVIPYVNSRLWSKGGNMKYTRDEKEALPYFEESITGGTNTWEANDGSHWNHVCVHTQYWRDFLANVFGDMVKLYGVDGVYADQGGLVCYAGGYYNEQGCFKAAHKHPLGVTRASTMAERIRQEEFLWRMRLVNPKAFLVGEGSSECFIDQIPLKLIHYEIWPGHVPSFEAVYHDYIATFGRDVTMRPKTPGDPRAFMQMGWLYTIGAQIGRLRAASLEAAEYREARDFLHRVTAGKDKYHRFLNLGEMQKPPMLSEVPLITTREFVRINNVCSFDSVLASAWRSPEGKVGIAVTNMAEKAQNVTISFDPAWYGFKGSVKVAEAFPADLKYSLRKRAGKDSLEVTLPAHSAEFFVLAE